MHHRKLLLMVVIITIIHTDGVSVSTKVETTTSESASNPKAEALTLLIRSMPPSAKIRPLKVIDRSDDVVVIHTNRSKRKPSSRKRRPSNQFRSKIRNPPSGSSSNVGGFKDFGSNDFRYPPFPNKNFGEPVKASNKYRFGPPTKASENQNFKSQSSKRTRRPQQIYGPPPTIDQFESTFNKQLSSSPFDSKTLQTLQQQQASFPSFSIDTVEPSNTNIYASSNNVERFPQPIGSFPLETAATYNSHKTSYGNPVRASTPVNSYQLNTVYGSNSHSNYNDNSNFHTDSNQHSNNNFNGNYNSNSNFPKLPNRYEQSDFSTPTRTNPLNSNSNAFADYSNINNDESNDNERYNIQRGTTKNRNRFKNFNKFNNYDYDFGKGLKNVTPDDDEEDEDFDYVVSTRRPFTTTTTTTTTELPFFTSKRPKKGPFGKRKRPLKVSQNHNLDTDELRDAFTESTDFHEVALNSEDFINFDSQRQNKRNPNTKLINEFHSTLKSTRHQNNALRSALGDDFQILSIQKSLEKNPNDVDFGFQRKNDDNVADFNVESEIQFDENSPAIWGGDFKNFPRNHKFS
ncbi:CLUMA_CG004467, isoform A [Clunio marinus]|uniref:CLUMA_CG004467, isoform A n=1 Tax=Clunio marinus TaxID=568069 RepID=A0A1J1HRU4_9DIPT|nr:CLUMA_CG004467, isoform A [Clunio marinus]